MYNSTRVKELIKWHVRERSKDNVTRYIVDSNALDHMNNKGPWFVKDECNVALILTLNGVNPYRNQSLSHLI